MRINAINLNEKKANNPAFKATFLENDFSQELRSLSSREDVDIFEKSCKNLIKAKNDSGYYLLDGVTVNNGMAGESEISDKFIKLCYKLSKNDMASSIRMWALRGEDCISGGTAKKDVLKQVAGFLERYAKENLNRKFLVK